MAKKPLQPRLSRVDFFRLHGDDFFDALSDSIESELGEGPQLARRFAAIKPAQQALYGWALLRGQVENGGLVQFFYNCGNAVVSPLAAWLKATGHQPLSTLLKQADAIYRRHAAEFRDVDPAEVFGDNGLFSRMKELNALDTPVERQLSRAVPALEKWVRRHIADLALGDDGRPIDPQFTGLVQVRRPEGGAVEELTVRRGVLDGPYRRYAEDGTVLHASFYKDGRVSTDFWPNGQPKHKKMTRGKRRLLEWYHPSGKLHKRMVTNQVGDAVEPIQLWHENGQLAEELHLRAGKKFGPWRKYFEDGAPRLEAEHRAGETLVVHNAWDDRRRQVVKNGRGVYYDDAKSINCSYAPITSHSWTSSSELREGIPHGTVTRWHDGVLWSVDQFRAGKPHGAHTTFYDNGRPRSRTTYKSGKEIKTEEFPKFDRPRPAVVLGVEADARLYQAWGHPLLDRYPVPRNLTKVQAQLRVPPFLEEVYQRNLAGTLREEYEDLNTFHDGATYFVQVDEKGAVAEVAFSGCSPYSAGTAGDYPPHIRKLRFQPGRLHGRLARCQVVVRVTHTFVEGGKRG